MDLRIGGRLVVPDSAPLNRATFDPRVADRLLHRGNTLAGVTAAVLSLLADGRDIPPEELRGYADDWRRWSADVRGVASEQRP